MDSLPLWFAIALSLPTCATQPLQKSNSVGGSTSNTFNGNEDGDYRFGMSEASTQKQAEIKPLNGGRVGVTQIERTTHGADFYVRKDQIFRQNLLKNLQRTFKEKGNAGAQGPVVASYPLITDLQRSRSEFEGRKQMALNRFRNAGNTLSNRSKHDQGRGGAINNRSVSFANQNRLTEQQASQLSSISNTGSWTKTHPITSNASPNAASEQTTSAKATNGQEQEVEHQEFESPRPSSSGTGAPPNSGSGSSHAGSGQKAGAVSTNGQRDEAEPQAPEYSGTASAPLGARKAPSVIKANSPVLPKQIPKVTPSKVQQQEVEQQESGSSSLTPSQRSVKSPMREVSTFSPPWKNKKAPTTLTTNGSPWGSQVSNRQGTGGSASNEMVENYVSGKTSGNMQQKQTNVNNHYIAHHDYHYERMKRMDRTLRILSRLGLSHVIPFITFQFMHNHPYALPLPHFPFLLEPGYFLHTGNSD
ncbi:hypothetical protein ACJMK2_024232 [Sinanodonta woodiana]|uniref:Uncharacterized protein n=1 Tax=Sinanodonta woodiana TaxID=1069815 RepID=A0ABD3T7R5_SINWO